MTEFDIVELKDVLREQRTSSGMTQGELSRLSGVSVRTIRHIEHGQVERPRRESVRRLLAAFESPARNPLAVDVLGPLVVHRGGGVVVISSPQQRCLVGLLALHVNRFVSQSEIVEVLWAGTPPATYRELLYSMVSRLRRRLGSGAVETLSCGYRLDIDPERVDLCRFAEQAARARGSGDPHAFAEALGLWRGPVLADLPEALRQHPSAASLQQQRIATALAFADLTFAGCGDDVLPWLAELVGGEPWHEELHARLILSLARSGRQVDAILAFQRIRDRLDHDLGLLPGPALRYAYESVLRQEVPMPRTAFSLLHDGRGLQT
ncbi:BTAD domain-containing putative transcriptional regulator [Lentzea sp. HUAS TT2]|uniref:BTAD domain-containing putative transcriptional regulator n=1 Tax=Lentzea sp. HUAS TT2 TaxID=3447454 RepID=UPI003F72DBD0